MSDPLPRMVRVTAGRPCPACKKPTWCLVSPDGKACICSRVESRKRCGEAGWLHRLEEHIPAFTPKPEPPKKPTSDWYRVARQYAKNLHQSDKDALAVNLGLPVGGLNGLHLVGRVDDCIVFPERDGTGQVIGLNRRLPDGRKLHLPGGGRGLTLPAGWKEIASGMPLYVVEGPTDCMAMVSAGLNAIGRPSNRGGVAFLNEILTEIDAPVIIMGENDQKDDGQWPGLVGAMAVAGELKRLGVKWCLPPMDYKDVREYLTGEQFDGVPWPERGKALEADLKVFPARHIPTGYGRYAEEAARTIGHDPNRWRD